MGECLIVNHSGKPKTLPISRGGTGATTAAGARNVLGLGNTSGALPIANGGTGATTAAAALKNLGGIAMKVLWENASAGSSFATQTLSVTGICDSTTYPYIMITSQRGNVLMKNVAGAANLCYIDTETGGMIYAANRDISLASNAITIGDNVRVDAKAGSHSGKISNEYNIPHAIIGIKGVS